jgi:hypothetical protein
MNRRHFLIVTLAPLLCQMAHADPIHAIADGAFWHHDSGWIFPAKIGEFERVGIPQDVAGSRDAVAYYARTLNGIRTVASVDVYTRDSGNEREAPPGRLESDDAFPVGKAGALSGRRLIYVGDGAAAASTGIYVIAAGEWQVRIRIAGVPKDLVPMMDSFALDQRWDTLTVEATSAATLR